MYSLSDAKTLNLTATVKISGETPTLEASGSKEVKITVTSPEPEVLQSIIVEISGNETLITDAGISASTEFTADVKGSYSDGQTRTLPSDSYALTWSASNVEGLSFSDGTLRVSETASVGTHEIQITATAISGDITGADTKTVIVTVRNVAQNSMIPVLTCSEPNISVKKGGTIASLTVRANITPQEWLTYGELPEGLSGRPDGDKFVISGIISANAGARIYTFTVSAVNVYGTSAPMMITFTVTENSVTPEHIEVPAGEISDMVDNEIAETFTGRTEIVLTGGTENLSETISRLESLTDVKTLDLSLVTNVSELKLENTKLESITLEGNQSIKEVEIIGNETLTTLNLSGSKVETVDAEGCTNLENVNIEGAESLTALNIKGTKITTLNAKDCAKLEMVDAKGCENLEEVNFEGCESLEYLDVSETAIKELNVQNCSNLGTLYCASCDIKVLSLEGCANMIDIDCSHNSLLMLEASELMNLRYLECRHQRAIRPLARVINFIDLLFSRGFFEVSATEESENEEINYYTSKVKNLKAYDEAGNEITAEYDSSTGDAEFSTTPYKITYDYDTGFDDILMDVEVIASEGDDNVRGDDNGSGNTEGGCGGDNLWWILVPTSIILLSL